MAKILRHYRISKETDALIKAEAARMEKSEADVIAMAIVRWCDSVAETPGIEKFYPVDKAKIIESPAQVPKMVKKVSKKQKAVEERAAGDLTARAVKREDIDYSDVESTPTTHVANLRGTTGAMSAATTKAVADWRAKRRPLLKPKEQ